MKTAVLMARVSSDEQAKGYSLDIQEDKLRSYCRRENIQIIKIFREDYSAKNFKRPEFQKFLTLAKQKKTRIDFLLFTGWDRFSRNLTDSLNMIRTLKNLGIQTQAVEQPIDFSFIDNKLLLAIYLAIPEVDNARRSMKIKEGIRNPTVWKMGHKSSKRL